MNIGTCNEGMEASEGGFVYIMYSYIWCILIYNVYECSLARLQSLLASNCILTHTHTHTHTHTNTHCILIYHKHAHTHTQHTHTHKHTHTHTHTHTHSHTHTRTHTHNYWQGGSWGEQGSILHRTATRISCEEEDTRMSYGSEEEDTCIGRPHVFPV